MEDDFKFRRAESEEDGQRLNVLFKEVFHPENVASFADAIFHHYPGMEQKYWFIAEEKRTSEIVSAFALIPWTWEIGGIPFKVAEMGIVGTLEKYRNQGMMKRLNLSFDLTLEAEAFDIAVIQGIPGFYDTFGYHFAVEMENHINLPLHIIPDTPENSGYTFRQAEPKDIPFLMEEDRVYRQAYLVSAVRDEPKWMYLLNKSVETEYGSTFHIIEHSGRNEKFYARTPSHGFGKGLIVSEVSEGISHEALTHMLSYCKQKAVEQNKPYIRLNVPHESTAGKTAIHMGAENSSPYAWQTKIPDIPGFLKKLVPILETRMAKSCFNNFSETLRLDFFKTSVDLTWKDGKIASVESDRPGECSNTFNVHPNLAPALCLGYRTWRELQHCRPDIFPASQYVRPTLEPDKTGLLIDVLFPKGKSWIHEQY